MFGFKKKQAYHKPAPGMVSVRSREVLDQAHTLIAGATGCGKSTVIHTILWSAIQRTPERTQLILIDMKAGIELGKYARLPHTLAFARSAQEALSALDKAIAIMQSRNNKMFAAGLTSYDGADVYVVIDELGFLLQSCGNEALKKLTLISQQGRAAKVHLLLATQNPSKKGIPAAIQQNMTCMIGLRCRSAIESRQIVGVAGCESLPAHGVAIMAIGADVEYVETMMIDDATQMERINYWSNPKNYTYYA